MELKLFDQRARRGEIQFVVEVRGMPLTAPMGPVEVTVVLGATPDAATPGHCGSRVLSSCSTYTGGRMAICR